MARRFARGVEAHVATPVREKRTKKQNPANISAICRFLES
jgi:hypothetical protein